MYANVPTEDIYNANILLQQGSSIPIPANLGGYSEGYTDNSGVPTELYGSYGFDQYNVPDQFYNRNGYETEEANQMNNPALYPSQQNYMDTQLINTQQENPTDLLRNALGNLSWDNRGAINPANALRSLLKRLGKPDLLDVRDKGVSIWKHASVKFIYPFIEQLEIHDERVPYKVPFPHYEYVYIYVSMNIPEHRIKDVLNISKSISYDSLKHWIRIRSFSIRSAIVLLATVYLLLQNQITLDDIKYNGLLRLFMLKVVKGSKKYNKRAYDSFLTVINKYYKKYKVRSV